MKTNSIVSWILVAGLALGASVAQAYEDVGEESMIMGPSVHAALGIRMRKAPDLDTYYSGVGGIKVSAFQLRAGSQMYISFIVPGLQYGGYGVFVPSLTPLIFNHNFGVGFGVDFYPVRNDRNGGPVGASINLDVMRIAQVMMNM